MSYEEMKKAADEHQGSIELRSEKVRNIIGQMPPFLIRWGNTLLVIIILFLVAFGYYFCRYYPKSLVV